MHTALCKCASSTLSLHCKSSLSSSSGFPTKLVSRSFHKAAWRVSRKKSIPFGKIWNRRVICDHLLASRSCRTHFFPELQYSPYRQSLKLSLGIRAYGICAQYAYCNRLWCLLRWADLLKWHSAHSLYLQEPPCHQPAKEKEKKKIISSDFGCDGSLYSWELPQIDKSLFEREKRGILQRFKTKDSGDMCFVSSMTHNWILVGSCSDV